MQSKFPLPAEPFARRVADAYRMLPVDSYATGDPATVRAYDALMAEIPAQYARVAARFDVVHTARDPYDSLASMLADMQGNRRMLVFNGGAPHPVLARVAFGGPVPVTFNDLFRAVHDCQHADIGAGFGPAGEDAVFRAHRDTGGFSRDAIRALATETRGQNNVYRFDKAYPAQKAGVLPDSLVFAD